jgi:hypothetical protein
MLILLGIMLPILLMMAGTPTAAYGPTGVTPTIGAGGVTPTIGAGGVTPVPVGGHLAMVDRGAVLQAAFGSLIMPLAALVIFVGVVGFVVTRRWPAN